MKKYLRYADVLVLLTGSLGLLLRLVLALVGTDERNLYPANHPSWVALCVLTVAVIALLLVLTRKAGTEDCYRRNFPASLPGAIGCGLGAVGVLVTAIGMLQADALTVVCALLGVGGAVGLALAGFCRFSGKKPHFAGYAALSVFFILRSFLLGRELGAEPEVCRYLFEILSSLALVPACYYMWGFAVDMGNRSKCLFWMLTAAYLCMVAVFSQDSWLLHLTAAAWMLTNLCPLTQLDKEEPIPQEPEAPEEAAAPAEDAAPIDTQAILAEIMKEIEET